MTNALPERRISREDMLARVARYRDLRGHDTGFSDSVVPNTKRTLLNVIGFQPPPGEGQVNSPVGADASRDAAIRISEGFNLAYVRCKPGHGPLMHNHDTNETFIPMTGRWRCSWDEEETQHVELGPLDVVSFPPGVARRFENITTEEPDAEHVLMVVISGDAPAAATTARAKELIEHHRRLAAE